VFVHRHTPKCRIVIFKENRTFVDVLGPAADVWGSRGREFKSRQPDQYISTHPA
jgi:hypothetical protein